MISFSATSSLTEIHCHQNQWLRLLSQPFPFGLSIAQLLSAHELLLLRIVDRSLGSISHEAAAYLFSITSWCPQSRTEVVDVIHQYDLRNNLVKGIRISLPFLPRAELTCSFQSYSSLLSSLRSLDLSNVIGLQDDDVDALLHVCSSLTFLDLSGSAMEQLTANCQLFRNPQSIASRQSLATLHLSDRVDASRLHSAGHFLQFDISFFPCLTTVHNANCEDDSFELFNQLPLLHSLTTDYLYVDNIGSAEPLVRPLSSLTELNLSRVVFVQDLCELIGTNLRLRRLSISMDISVNNEDITDQSLTTLLGQHSTCYNTLEELHLDQVDSIPLDCLFNLSASLTALRAFRTLCQSDLSRSPTAKYTALRNLLDSKRHQLLLLGLPRQVSAFEEGDLILSLMNEGGPIELHIFCDALSWNRSLHHVSERNNTQCLPMFQHLLLRNPSPDSERQNPFFLQSLRLPCFESLVQLELHHFALLLPSFDTPLFNLFNLRHLRIYMPPTGAMNESLFSWWSQVAPHVTSFHYGIWWTGRGNTLFFAMDHTFCCLRELEVDGFLFGWEWWDGLSRLPHLYALVIGLAAKDVMQLERCVEMFTRNNESFLVLMEFRVRIWSSDSASRLQAETIWQSIRTRVLRSRPYLKFLLVE